MELSAAGDASQAKGPAAQPEGSTHTHQQMKKLKADFAEQIIRLLRRSSCIPADTIGETAGVAYRRARLHRRLKRGASAAVTTSVQMAGTAVRSSSRMVKEAANRNRPPPATPDTHTAVERQATRQASLRAASPVRAAHKSKGFCSLKLNVARTHPGILAAVSGRLHHLLCREILVHSPDG